MATIEEVQLFLRDFHQKTKIWGVRVRDDRGKNTQALHDLEINVLERLKIIENLSTDDFCVGPNEDTLNAGAPLWVFGKRVKNILVYIKITMGAFDKPVTCISFHEAERELLFPYKGA